MIARETLKDKVLGCWYGKNIGGTLGAPFEWKRQINDVEFYTQDLGGKALPNDDLDLQLMWLAACEEQQMNISARTLGYYFGLYLTPHWAEYGVAKANLRAGIQPPYSGQVNNNYRNSCGSYIRSEIWACICAGDPYRAAKYMIMDSSVDHGGSGEGTYAAVFVAAMDAAAFVTGDIRALIDCGLSFIPEDCKIRRVTDFVTDCYDRGVDWVKTRDEVIRRFGGAPMRHVGRRGTMENVISERDRREGLDCGILGDDVAGNIGLMVLALVYGEGDFGKTLCTAVNCGEDTDCTAATAGSILGIIGGKSGIPEKWIEPIGNAIVTLTIDVPDLCRYIPKTVDELTDRVLKLNEKEACEFVDGDLGCTPLERDNLYRHADSIAYSFPSFDVYVSYPDGMEMRDGGVTVRVDIANKYRVFENIDYVWLTDGVTADKKSGRFSLSSRVYGTAAASETFRFSGESGGKAVLLLEMQGKAFPMSVPVTIL